MEVTQIRYEGSGIPQPDRTLYLIGPHFHPVTLPRFFHSHPSFLGSFLEEQSNSTSHLFNLFHNNMVDPATTLLELLV